MSAMGLFKFFAVIFFCTQSNGYMTINAWPGNTTQLQDVRIPPPPPVDQEARMARYLVHISDWCTITSISSQGNTTGYPRARIYSFVDGADFWSTGIPYIYATLKDPLIQDLVKNNRCSVAVSMAQGDYCRKQNYDPEDPRCAQVLLTGEFSFVQNHTTEYNSALNALFLRHPDMPSWPRFHHWKVGKLTIQHIQVVANFGGSKYPSVQEYFKATPY